MDSVVDAHGREITAGAIVLAPFAKGGAGDGAKIVRATVTAIAPLSHRGYGYFTRKLTLRTADGKTMTHNYPANCILVD